MNEFQGLLALAALLVALVVHVWQAYTHHQQVKHQLFDKRWAVYEAVGWCLFEHGYQKDDLDEFYAICRPSRYLFKDDVNNFMSRLYALLDERYSHDFVVAVGRAAEEVEQARKDRSIADLKIRAMAQEIQPLFGRYLILHTGPIEALRKWVDGVEQRLEKEMGGQS
jgi:hypothetical protein